MRLPVDTNLFIEERALQSGVAHSLWGWDSAVLFMRRVRTRALRMTTLFNLKSRRV